MMSPSTRSHILPLLPDVSLRLDADMMFSNGALQWRFEYGIGYGRILGVWLRIADVESGFRICREGGCRGFRLSALALCKFLGSSRQRDKSGPGAGTGQGWGLS